MMKKASIVAFVGLVLATYGGHRAALTSDKLPPKQFRGYR